MQQERSFSGQGSLGRRRLLPTPGLLIWATTLFVVVVVVVVSCSLFNILQATYLTHLHILALGNIHTWKYPCNFSFQFFCKAVTEWSIQNYRLSLIFFCVCVCRPIQKYLSRCCKYHCVKLIAAIGFRSAWFGPAPIAPSCHLLRSQCQMSPIAPTRRIQVWVRQLLPRYMCVLRSWVLCKRKSHTLLPTLWCPSSLLHPIVLCYFVRLSSCSSSSSYALSIVD